LFDEQGGVVLNPTFEALRTKTKSLTLTCLIKDSTVIIFGRIAITWSLSRPCRLPHSERLLSVRAQLWCRSLRRGECGHY